MDGERFNMDGDKDSSVMNEKEEKKQSLMEFINEDANPPVRQKPYWLCGKCMNSYSSRHYLLKKHRCTKTADGRRRQKEDPPQQPYALKSRCESAKIHRKKAVCCQINLGRKLSHLLGKGKIRKETLNERQKECVHTYHSSLL